LIQGDIKVIVDKHNELRRKVAKGLEIRGVNGPQPKAADMYELVWDPVLAASAQRLFVIFKLLISLTCRTNKLLVLIQVLN